MKCKVILSVVSLVCIYAGTALAIQFDHDEHMEYLVDDKECSACHKKDARMIVPAKDVCLECHEEDFYAGVTFAGTRTHGPVWSLNHRAPVKGGAVDCSACHEQQYCLECHKAGFADEMGEFGNNMINVHRSEFHVSHPIAARTDPQLCAGCHENRFATPVLRRKTLLSHHTARVGV
jgi:hypothetical protein